MPAPVQRGHRGFQFPSNGKVYSEPAEAATEVAQTTTVSIPFKRESVFRVSAMFNVDVDKLEFQFPSNGKVYSEA